jgi:hypothetical protein
MSPPDRNYLIDPVRAPFQAAQRVAAPGEGVDRLDAVPEGEVIWREDGDTVRLTPDGWLVYLNGGKAGLFGRRFRSTPELVATMRGWRERPPTQTPAGWRKESHG